jgi:acylglycerol lipase
MNSSSSTVQGARGLRLHVQRWEPGRAPRGSIVVAHGFAEHGGRYAALAERLVDNGFAVVIADHRGHGRSEGRRRSIVRFSDYVDDLKLVVDAATTQVAGAPLVVLGHSMGGLVALSFALRFPESLQALVLSAPAACPGTVSPLQLMAGRLLARVAPDTGVLKLPLHTISKDPAVVEAYMNDPLVSPGKMRARMGAEMLDTMAAVDAALPSLRLPLLVMQGSEDRLVDPGCGPHVFERAGSPDKTLHVYPGLWHEIFNEPERATVIADLLQWLDAHVPSAEWRPRSDSNRRSPP